MALALVTVAGDGGTGCSVRPALPPSPRGGASGTACPSPCSAVQHFSLHDNSLSPHCRRRGHLSQIGCLARSLEEALIVVASAHQPPPSQVLGSRVWDAWVTSPMGSSRELQLRDPDAAPGTCGGAAVEGSLPAALGCPRSAAVPAPTAAQPGGTRHHALHREPRASRVSAPGTRRPGEEGLGEGRHEGCPCT